MTNIILPEFDVGVINSNTNILINGAQGCGKTYLVNHLLSELQATSSSINTQVDESLIQKIISDIPSMSEVNKYIVIDDYDSNTLSHDQLKQLLACGFEYNVCFIICTQSLCQLSDEIIDNMDFIFVLKSSIEDKKYLADKFNMDIKTIFPYLLDGVNRNYRSLVIDNRTFGDIDNPSYYSASNVETDNESECTDESDSDHSDAEDFKHPSLLDSILTCFGCL
jgi:GTPase SAR1 family protein